MDWILFVYGWCSTLGLVAACVAALFVVLFVADQVSRHPDSLGCVTRWLDDQLFGLDNDACPGRTLLLVGAVILGELIAALWFSRPLDWLRVGSWWGGLVAGVFSLAILVLCIFAVDRYRHRRTKGRLR